MCVCVCVVLGIKPRASALPVLGEYSATEQLYHQPTDVYFFEFSQQADSCLFFLSLLVSATVTQPRVGELAERVKALVPESGDLSLISRTHIVEEKY